MTLEEYIFSFLKTSELAACSAFEWIGRGKNNSADEAAVHSIRKSLSNIGVCRIIAGEGERDNAPMLIAGEQIDSLGNKNLRAIIDVAVDPLECTNYCADGKGGSMSIIAFSQKDKLLKIPDVYMEKLAWSNHCPKDLLSLSNSIEENIMLMASYKCCSLEDIRVILLNRSRHDDLIKRIRKIGARAILIDDGDVWGCMSTCFGYADIYFGIGGSPEGLLSAVALKCLGGNLLTRFVPSEDKEKNRLKEFDFLELDTIYSIEELVIGDSVFIASGVTGGDLLKGVGFDGSTYTVHSVVLNSFDNSIKHIKSEFNKPKDGLYFSND